MNRLRIGTIKTSFTNITNLYKLENGTFDFSEEDLNNLAKLINNPWSDTSHSYYITFDEELNIWICDYHVYVYTCIECSIYGYGQNELLALQDCKLLFKELKEIYNK